VIALKLHLDLLPMRFAIAQLEGESEIPEWAQGGEFCSVTKSSSELSIVCEESRVPVRVRAQRGLRCFRVRGPIEFEQVGVLNSLAEPLGRAGVSLFTLSTYDTDYILVSSDDLETAEAALVAAGHVWDEASAAG